MAVLTSFFDPFVPVLDRRNRDFAVCAPLYMHEFLAKLTTAGQKCAPWVSRCGTLGQQMCHPWVRKCQKWSECAPLAKQPLKSALTLRFCWSKPVTRFTGFHVSGCHVSADVMSADVMCQRMSWMGHKNDKNDSFDRF